MGHLHIFKQLNRERSNRGAALITVLIVTSIVTIFGLMSMSAAYTNFRMKVVDRDSAETFYGTEKIVEDFGIELQKVVSESHNYAYSEVMSVYDSYEDPGKMKQDYERLFVEYMGMLLDKDNNGYYNLTDAEVVEGTTLAKVVQTIETEYTNEKANKTAVFSSETGKNLLQKTVSSLIIRDLSLTYTEEGMGNKITTDIRLDVPDVTFSVYSEAPIVTDYAMVVGDGMQVLGQSNVSITGKVNVGLLDDLYYPITKNYSIVLESGATLSVNDAELTAQGTVELFNGAVFQASETTDVWAHGINTHATTGEIISDRSNELILYGNTYIKDDITINGTGNTLRLGGNYFGYSDGSKMVEMEDGTEVEVKSADISSAIIVNGRDTWVDLSTLKTMVLAGTSYVGTKNESMNVNGNTISSGSDVMLGDSFAIKSNQLIYMVPTECEGIKNNPMTYDEYLRLEEGWQEKVLKTILGGLGRSISSYGNVEIVPVFTNKSGGGVYLYLQFENEQVASEYFMDCFGTTESGSKAKEFMKNYVSAIGIAEEAQILAAGNYLKKVDGSYKYEGSTEAVDALSLDGAYQDLITRYQFSEIVREEVINGNFETSSGDVQFVVVDNEGGEAYTVASNFKGILIATGDVRVTSNAGTIQGMILCKGKLDVVGSGMRLENNQDYIAKALGLSKDGISAKSFFKGYYHVSTESKGESAVTDVRQCISFENWRVE